jgi:hypothetical protein
MQQQTDQLMQQETARLASLGWEITSASPDMITLVRQKNANSLAVAIGCLFGILPGIFIYLLGRGRESKVLSRSGIEAQIAANMRAEEARRQAKINRQKRDAEWKEKHTGLLGILTPSVWRIVLVLAIMVGAVAICVLMVNYGGQ